MLVGNYSVYSQSKNHIETWVPQFIILSNVGISNYSIPPLVISADSINIIEYPEGEYDQYAKFNKYKNVIIQFDKYLKLYNYFNVADVHNERPNKFIVEEKPYFIVDYRDSVGTDYILLTLKDLTSTFFVLKNLYCFLDRNSFEQELIDQIVVFYNFYIDTYDPEHHKIIPRMICE